MRKIRICLGVKSTFSQLCSKIPHRILRPDGEKPAAFHRTLQYFQTLSPPLTLRFTGIVWEMSRNQSFCAETFVISLIAAWPNVFRKLLQMFKPIRDLQRPKHFIGGVDRIFCTGISTDNFCDCSVFLYDRRAHPAEKEFLFKSCLPSFFFMWPEKADGKNCYLPWTQ